MCSMSKKFEFYESVLKYIIQVQLLFIEVQSFNYLIL